MRIGVLALQGDFAKHIDMLESLDVKAIPVKKPEELARCCGLIMPGGESTTLVKLLHSIDLFDKIKPFSEKWPVFGTCAGAILLSNEVTNHPVQSFQLIDISIRRNAYGTQVDSFSESIRADLGSGPEALEGVFIRAPQIERLGDEVKAIAWHGDDVVMVEQGNILAATFHPELTDSNRIHQYFVQKVKRKL